ncbi:MAG TPA: efflux RND transporter periplasmic adaptor subunit [Anaerolineae bacterium]|jgi:multidrug resistance efflux pump
MKHKIVPFIVILLLAGGIGGGYWYLNQHPDELIQLQLRFGLISESEATGVQTVSGFIEADEIDIAPEAGGRIVQLTVGEGDFVEAGQLLVELDTALLQAELARAEAKIAVAQAQLAKVEAGVQAEEIAKAEAAVAVAEANAEAAHQLWQDTIILRDNPQELDMQIDAARTALDLADLAIAYAIPFKDSAEALWELGRNQWEDVVNGTYVHYYDPIKDEGVRDIIHPPEGEQQRASVAWNLAGANQWEAWVNLNTATAQRDEAETHLDDLLRLRNDPQVAQIQVAQAEAAYQTALSEVDVAAARLGILEAGPRAEQIAVAQAQVDQAEAALTALTVDRNKHILVAAQPGWVTEKIANEGEMAVPGTTLLKLADLGNVTLTVYVAESNIDTVSAGQAVDVRVDAFPGQTFTGHITFINDEAEFTPKNVQTREERVNTVFAVKIKLKNEDQQLKPGMPADAILNTRAEL